MGRSSRGEGGAPGPPTQFAEGPPPPAAESAGFPLLAIMEMQRTLGSLTQAVESLQAGQHALQVKVDTLAHTVETARTVVWVVGLLLGGGLAFVGWLINNAITLLPALLGGKSPP